MRFSNSARIAGGAAFGAVLAGAVLWASIGGGAGSSAHAAASPTAASASESAHGSTAPPIDVTLSRSDCAPEWTASKGGQVTFAMRNTTIAGADAYLENAATGAVYAEFEALGSGASIDRTVVIGDGTYKFECFPEDEDAVEGKQVDIAGSSQTTGLTPAVMPVTNNDMIPVVKAYAAWVDSQLPTLLSDSQALNAAVAAGDLGSGPAGARTLWLTAHLDYATLGAAYGAFGDSDAAINGNANDLPGGVNDPDFTGFHRIEYLLWHGASAADIAPYTSQLVADVQTLQATFTAADIDPLDIGLRAHEIVENAVEFELTARTDEGSGTSLATVDANLTGDRELIDLQRGVLSSRMSLDGVDEWMSRAQTAVETQHHPDGTWTPISQLTISAREQIDAAMTQLDEQLSTVAAVTDIRPASTP
jgi:iron uptake system component EfeO